MSTIGEALERDWATIRHHLPHHHYDATNQTPEAPMLPIVAAIENDLSAAGHAVDDALHGVLARHLTLGNLAAHVAQQAAAVEASPLVQALERLALGPAGEAALAKVVEDVAGLVAPVPQGPDLQAGTEPAPAQ